MSYYPIQLDKSRNFKFGMKAISLIEKKFKKPIAKVDVASLTMEETATFIWAGLVHEDRGLTPDKVMDLIDDHSSIPAVMEVMTEALNGSFGIKPESEVTDEKN